MVSWRYLVCLFYNRIGNYDYMNLMVECLTPVSLIVNAYQSNPNCTDIYQSAIVNDAGGFAEYLPVFFMTYILEFPIYFIFLFRNSSIVRMVLIGLILNVATHPFIYKVLPPILAKWDMSYLEYLIIAEIFAPTIEAILLKKVFHTSWKIAFWAAILANLFSWTIGVYWQS